jgi:hypothetical protein
MKTAAQYRAFHAGKSVTNERTYPYLVEIPVAAAGLDVARGRQIMEFHKSRHIQLRHGRTILKYGDTYYRWCFADLSTAHVSHRRACDARAAGRARGNIRGHVGA